MGVTRKAFDFVVGVDGNFKDAMAAAAKSASAGNRFYLFFPDGDYDIGTLTGNGNQMTTFPTSNVSFIGQSADKTVIFNKSSQEGISVTATLYFNKANNLYLQDLTILNKACYGNPSTYSTTSRHVAVMEQGNDIVYKNVKLLSTQDTYYTKGNRTYWENGEIHGTTDFICGGGDILFNKCLIYIDKVSCITAPATSTTWGYVFLDCTIDGSVGSYRLGRSWNNSPKCVYINTTMKKVPSTDGWGDPMNVVPSLFAEYNSKTASGSAVDLGGRRKTYSLSGTTVTINPVLTADQAAKYTVANIMSDWKPDDLVRQTGAPTASQDVSTLKWNDDPSALCWAVFKDNKFFKCVTATSCDIASGGQGKYTVRAANAMGGLGPVSTLGTGSGFRPRNPAAIASPVALIHDHARKMLCFRSASEARFTARVYAPDGKTVLSKRIILGSGAAPAEVSLSGLGQGSYMVACESPGSVRIERLLIF
jgi:pectin methylesterase-like acyl-CoA thioesterase